MNFDAGTKTIFQETLTQLKQGLQINDSEYEEWTSTTLEPTPQTETGSKSYLIIKIDEIDEIDNQEKTDNSMYRLDAWLLDSTNKYYPLGTTILKRIEDNKFDSMEAIESLFGKFISDYHERTSNDLIIEFFVCNDLLLDNFDCWKYEVIEKIPIPLNTYYLVHVRSLLRTTSPPNLPMITTWKNRWKIFQQARLKEHSLDNYETYFCNPETIWGNLCSSDKDSLKHLLNKIVAYGVPVAIWSREYTEAENHRKKINALVEGRSCAELSQEIKKRRLSTPDSDGEPDRLKDNLSLLWEDPNRIPPSDKINTGHFAQ